MSIQRCATCHSSFEITQKDLQFYSRVAPSIKGTAYPFPAPTQCPQCRKRLRLAFHNDRHLHHRTSSLSGKDIISVYTSEAPFPVYDHEEWWSDRWNPLDYGRPFSFERLFFEQFYELLNVVPRPSIYASQCENCKYSFTANSKNCYLIAAASNCEGCMYSYRINYSKDCLDCLLCWSSELCYECVHIRECYRCHYSSHCSGCSESFFLFDCSSCSHCTCCAGLSHKKYCIFNIQYSEDEYLRRLSQMSLFTRTGVMQTEISFNLFLSSIPRRALQLRSTENVVGDIVRNAKDCTDVYDGEELKDVHFAHFASKLNDSQDVNWGFDAELQYEVCVTGLSCSRIAFCIDTWPSIHDLYYSAYCQGGTANCFGCVGLQKYEFCILNQQYSREEYEVLIPRIITHMQKTGEWGKFFPAALSPFGYNQTTAQEYLPLSKAQALSLGFYWADLNQEDQSAHNDKEVLEVVTDDIRHVSDTLTSNVFRCQKSNKLFRILRSELQWYRSQEIPLPRHHPDERHRARIARRNPCVIRQDLCASCGRGTTTTYAAEQQLQILCEECYRARE